MQNPGKKWYRRTYFQGRTRDKDVEIGSVNLSWGSWGEMNWKIRIDMYTPSCVN